jgi:hypothetical protein
LADLGRSGAEDALGEVELFRADEPAPLALS